MVTADFYYTDRECLVDFFCNPGLKNCWHRRLGIGPEPEILVLSQVPMTSQPLRPKNIQVNKSLRFICKFKICFDEGLKNFI